MKISNIMPNGRKSKKVTNPQSAEKYGEVASLENMNDFFKRWSSIFTVDAFVVFLKKYGLQDPAFILKAYASEVKVGSLNDSSAISDCFASYDVNVDYVKKKMLLFA
jgi:hypothetical protein